MGTYKATACVVLAGILWGCICIFTDALGEGGFSPIQITLTRMVVGTAGMLAIVVLRDPSKLRIRPRDIWMFIGTGVVSLALFNLMYFSCMEQGGVSVAVVLLYTSPVFVMVMGALFFGERVTAKKVVALAMTMAGSAFVAGLLGGGVHISPAAMAAGIGSGFFYALYSIFARVALRRYDTVTVTTYTFACGAAALLPLSDVGEMVHVMTCDPTMALWGLGIGAACTIAPFMLYTTGLANMESGRAAILAMVEPLVGTLIGLLVFHEPFDLFKALGVVLIFMAVFILGMREKTSQN